MKIISNIYSRNDIRSGKNYFILLVSVSILLINTCLSMSNSKENLFNQEKALLKSKFNKNKNSINTKSNELNNLQFDLKNSKIHKKKRENESEEEKEKESENEIESENEKKREKEKENEKEKNRPIIKLKPKAIAYAPKREYLPKILTINNDKFTSIKIKFVHVDKDVEQNGKESDFSNDDYNIFLNKILEPVANYIGSKVKVYPVRDSKVGNCYADFEDKDGNKRIINHKANVYMEQGYVSNF